MNFLKKLLTSNGADPFGVDAALAGIKALKSKLSAELERLDAVKAKARDAALDDPDADVDESPIIRQRERIKIFEAATEKAISSAAAKIDSRMDEIKTAIGDLEKERADLLRKCDSEMLALVADFVKKTGGRLIQAPTRGQGGTISVPAARALDAGEIEAALAGLPKPGSPLNGSSKALEELASKLEKLTMITHYGSRKGLETLVNSKG